MSKLNVFLGAILALFLFTRLFQISNIPASVYWDEASIGYNAYSILQTGHDEWGKSFPLHFRAFGEFKLPVYVYSVVLSEAIFNMNSLAVRLPAVFFSLGVVCLTFLLALKAIGNKGVALFSALFISTMPWFFIFSRVGYEASAGLFFYLLGIYFFIVFKKKWVLILTFVSLILSMYSYNSFRVLAPITAVILSAYILYKVIKGEKRILVPLILGVLIFAISIIPIYKLYKYDSGASRISAVSVNSSQGIVTVSEMVFGNYLSHFSLDFLFINGDSQIRIHQIGFGELFWVQLPLLILGLFYIYKKRNPTLFLFLVILLIAPLPAAVTRESPHSLRAVTMAPFLAIISSLGMAWIFENIKRERIRQLVGGLAVLIILISFGLLFNNFIQNYNQQSADAWQLGYKKIFTDYSSQFGQYNHIYISDNYAQPYIFGLFYLKVDPGVFRSDVKYNDPSDWGFSTVRSFEKFIFIKDKEIANIKERGILVFASPDGRQNNREPINIIKTEDGKDAFYVYSQ